MYIKQILLVLGLLIIILYNSSVSRVETFNNNIKNNTSVVLLGDSILKNNSYVKNGFAVDELLRKKCLLENITITNYAREDAQLSDVYEQIDTTLGSILNSTTTNIIFLSVGGNNIIEKNTLTGKVTKSDVDAIFEKYKKVIDIIKMKQPNSKLFLLNIYHIYDAKLNPVIDNWNELLFSQYTNIVDINSLLSQPSDLIFKIEPSETGGDKIATKLKDIILQTTYSLA